jgi:hypothetical protein
MPESSLVARPPVPPKVWAARWAEWRPLVSRGAEWIATWTPLWGLDRAPVVSSPEEMELRCRRLSRAHPEINDAVVRRIVGCEQVRARLAGRQRRIELGAAAVSLLLTLVAAAGLLWSTRAGSTAQAPAPAEYFPGVVGACAASFLGLSGLSRALRKRRMHMKALFVPVLVFLLGQLAFSFSPGITGDAASWVARAMVEGFLSSVAMLILFYLLQLALLGLGMRVLIKDEVEAGEAPIVGSLAHVVHSHTWRTPWEMGVEDQERDDTWMREAYTALKGRLHRTYRTRNRRQEAERHECFLEASAVLREAEDALARRDSRDLARFDAVAVQIIVALLDRNWRLLPAAPRPSRLSTELQLLRTLLDYVPMVLGASLALFVRDGMSFGDWMMYAVVVLYAASIAKTVIADRERPARSTGEASSRVAPKN